MIRMSALNWSSDHSLRSEDEYFWTDSRSKE